jgi:hypothetical protein
MSCVSDTKLKIVHAGREGFPQGLKVADVSVALTARLKEVVEKRRPSRKDGKTTTRGLKAALMPYALRGPGRAALRR